MSTLKVTHLQNENGTGPAMSIAVGGGVTFAGITTFHSNVDLGSNSLSGDLTGNVTGNVTGNLTGDVTVATGATVSGSTNIITASTNGAGRIYVGSDGRVAIGSDVTNPSSVLTIRDFPTDFDRTNGNGTAILNVQGGTTQGVGQIGGSICLSKVNSTRPGAVIAAVQTDSDVDRLGLSVYTHPSSSSSSTVEEKLRITHAGNVGIGTDDPEGPCHILSDSNALAILESSNTNSDLVQADPSGSTRIRNNSGELKIYTGGDASSHNAANSSLAATFNTDGNLVFPVGQGIDFSVTAGSGIITNGGILDDYEEGTWTIGISFNGSTSGVVITNDDAFYIKVGRMVTCWGRLSLSNNGSGVGGARITGLPFTVADVVATTGLDGGGLFCYQNNVTGTVYGSICILPEDGETTANLYGSTDTSGNMVGMTNSNISDTFDSRFVFSYPATA